jgi:glycosyltransferase involved in cell wall biosynthesis
LKASAPDSDISIAASARPGRQPRLAVVLSHPTQYYSPWFRWLRTHTALDFRVFYLWKFGHEVMRDPEFEKAFAWDVDLLGGYESEFVPNTASDPGTHHFWGLRNPSLPARLAAWQPGALLLFGYAYPSHLRALVWARRRRVPLIFRGDSHFLGRPPPRGWKRFMLRALYRQFAALTVVGAANRDYFAALGAPAEKMFFAPHSVDSERFDPNHSEYRSAARALRAQLGIASTARVVLFAGKFIPAKQPRELLEAFLEINAPGAALVFVGDGEEKNALLDRARAAPAGRVHFLPFANQSEMPIRHLVADIFALPSRGLYETWGLAVNEAMHLGVPCLVSDLVGCQRDLVVDGETGWVFSGAKSVQLREKLALALAAPPDELEKIRRAVARKISGYTYAQTTDGFLQALAFATHIATEGFKQETRKPK